MKIIAAVPLVCALGCVVFTQMASGQNHPTAGIVPEEIARRLEEQQQQINDLRRIVEAQQRLLEKVSAAAAPVPALVIPAAVALHLTLIQERLGLYQSWGRHPISSGGGGCRRNFGSHSRKSISSRLSRTAQRTWRRRWAPSADQRIGWRFPNLWLTK
jgi:hypothetical protein